MLLVGWLVFVLVDSLFPGPLARYSRLFLGLLQSVSVNTSGRSYVSGTYKARRESKDFITIFPCTWTSLALCLPLSTLKSLLMFVLYIQFVVFICT